MGVAIAALENGVIARDDTCNCRQYYTDTSGKTTGHTCLDYHGELNVIEAIRESCNVFFYRLGELMGIENITPYTEKLGLGAQTGIELGDKTGMIAGPEYRDEQWFLGDDLNASIGQSDHGYTPLQMGVYLSTIVNGGTRYNATILDSVRTPTGETVAVGGGGAVASELSDEEYSETTREILIDAMAQVVNDIDGSVHKSGYLKNVPVTVGGKTGTSEVDGKKDYAIFSGFAPLESPEIVVSCVLEEGEYGYRAAYTVGKIMEKYYALKGESTQTP
jgi:penicillin-binding protein 2